MWRQHIRTWSGMVIVSFVIPHLISHGLGLISLEAAETMRQMVNIRGRDGDIALFSLDDPEISLPEIVNEAAQ